MTFIRNFADDRTEQVYLMLFGAGKIGKTTCVLDLVERERDYVVMLSMDGGWKLRVRHNPDAFQKHLVVAEPRTLGAMRKDFKEARFVVEKVAKAGVSRNRIWVCLDTITHAQTLLMAEARKISIKNPRADDARDEYVRDATTDVDWMVNLGHMSEVADALLAMGCNVVVIAHEKEQAVNRKKTGVMIPAIGGQSLSRFMGDADAVLYMTNDGKQRILEPFVDGDLTGDRSGRLGAKETTDLRAIANKMLGLEAPKLAADTEPEKEEAGQAVQA